MSLRFVDPDPFRELVPRRSPEAAERSSPSDHGGDRAPHDDRELKGIAGQQRPYIDWLLERRVAEGVVVGEIVTDEALRLLARRLGTPLQIEQYLTRAFEEGLRVGEKSVTAQLIEALLSPQLDEVEPRLRQHGYDVPDLAELSDAGQGEIRSLLRSELEPVRSRELTAKPTAAGLPI